jgi:hypothetical protein
MRLNYYLQEGKVEKSNSTIINKVAGNLAAVLPYIRIDNKPFRFGIGVYASNKKADWGNPLTCPGMAGVDGIAVYIDDKEKDATIYEITAANAGMGTKMLEAILNGLPEDYKINIHHDWSGGWWDKIMKKYSKRQWVVT